jgi:hypothetical protein
MTNLTTEARRHGEESGDRGIARDRVIGGATDSCHDVKIGHAAAFCHPERPRVERGETRGNRRIPIKIIPEHEASGSSHETLKNAPAAALYQGTGFSRAAKGKNTWASAPAIFAKAIRTLRAALREIFDESAYDRFLLRTHASRSVASYRAFTRERDAALLKKPRCC